jgi:hypothetical protein
MTLDWAMVAKPDLFFNPVSNPDFRFKSGSKSSFQIQNRFEIQFSDSKPV